MCHASTLPALLFLWPRNPKVKYNLSIIYSFFLCQNGTRTLPIDVCALPLRLILGPKHYEHLAETRAPSWLSWAQGKGFFMYQGKGLLHVMSFPEESQHTVKPTCCEFVLLRWHIFGGGDSWSKKPRLCSDNSQDPVWRYRVEVGRVWRSSDKRFEGLFIISCWKGAVGLGWGYIARNMDTHEQ